MGLVSLSSGQRTVREATLLSAEPCKLSLVDGTAFLWPDTDISAYAGVEGTKTQFSVIVTDSAGKTARGYLGAAGAGETLSGSELVTNYTWDANTTGWAALRGSIASIAGGQSNNCLELTSNGETGGAYAYQTSTATTGMLVKESIYIKSGTAGATTVVAYIGLTQLGAYPSGTTTDSWVQKTGYQTVTTNLVVQVKSTNAVNGQTTLADELSIQQVTDCPVTALHIVSAKDGSTHNWKHIDSGFNYNATTYNVQIMKAR